MAAVLPENRVPLSVPTAFPTAEAAPLPSSPGHGWSPPMHPVQKSARSDARCLVMGILNVTPDSFSDGGSYLGTHQAIEHGLALAAAGADIVDVGGESTRLGALRVPPDEEKNRVLPVIRVLAAEGIRVSVDTTCADGLCRCSSGCRH